MDQEQEGKVSKEQQEWKAPKFKQSTKIQPGLQAEINQQEARQAAVDRLKADEVRRSIGLPTRESLPENLDQFNTTPLPLPSIHQGPPKLTWKDFDQDESGQNIYLYRGLADRDREWAQTGAHLAGSGNQETDEQIYARYETDDQVEIARKDSMATNFNPATLHTTRSREFAAKMAGNNGSVIRYKVPKSWFANSGKPIEGSIGESEIDFFRSIPAEFVDEIGGKEFDEQEVLHERPQPFQEVDDIAELPPPPPKTDMVP